MAPKDIVNYEEAHVLQMSGTITCDSPNEFLDRWDGNITSILKG